MAKKRLAIIIDHSPLNTEKVSEGLRMAVGQTLAENQVTIILLDAGVWASTPLRPATVKGGELKKHIDTIILLKHRVWVEEESLQRYGIGREQVLAGIEVVSRRQVEEELAASEAVIRF
ncbi:MAG: DsrE family protein [Dehalococcoidia bacterium]|nr:DsrE family protein [Dehalococcoidia bacterium]